MVIVYLKQRSGVVRVELPAATVEPVAEPGAGPAEAVRFLDAQGQELARYPVAELLAWRWGYGVSLPQHPLSEPSPP